MPRRSVPTSPLVVIDDEASTPLWRQIYDQLRQAVVSGRLPAGVQLPPSRALAEDLVISRNSVTAAYAQLAAEGYLQHRQRLGTFAASVVPDVPSQPRTIQVATSTTRAKRSPRATRRTSLSATGETFVAAAKRLTAPSSGRMNSHGPPLPFRIGDPAIDAFPVALWSRLLSRRWRGGSVPLGYSEPGGAQPLRAAVASYLSTSRAVRCDPSQVFIASGTQQAVDLAIRLIMSPGDAVWIESPGYPGARAAIEGAGGTVVAVPVDSEGLVIESGILASPRARAAYVTPSHQFPLGAVMSVARRLALLNWAADVMPGCWRTTMTANSGTRAARSPRSRGLITMGE